jgi:TolB-like protein
MKWYDAAVVKAISSSMPEPIARFKSGVTGELQQIVDKALAKEVSIRYQHADDMLADLKRLQMETPRSKKSKLGLWIAGAVIIIVGGYFGFSMLSDETIGPVEAKRLVVLPFDNLGGEDQDYFASGMTEEVISRLSGISDLAVVSRHTAAKLKGEGLGIDEIGRKLGVEYVLDASARYQESSEGHRRVRMVIQLINVTEDRVIWSQTYDTVMNEIFAVQSNIAEAVAEQMDIVLLEPERQQIRTRWTDNEEAYDLLLKAWKADYTSREGIHAGLKMLKRAVELDSGFVVAHAHLADLYGRLYAFFTHGGDSLKSLCRKSAEKAARLSDHRWAKNWPLGRYYYLCEKDYHRAIEYTDIAYDKNRNNVWYLTDISWMNIRAGRWQEGYDMYKRTIELEPTENWRYRWFGWMSWYMRKYPESISCYRRYLNLNPQETMAVVQLAMVYIEWKADIEAARELFREFSSTADTTDAGWIDELNDLDVFDHRFDQALERLGLSYSDAPNYSDMAWIYRSLGDSVLARVYSDSSLIQAINREEKQPDYYGVYGTSAMNYAIVGDKDKALEAWERRIELMPLSRDAGSQRSNGLLILVNMYAFLGEPDVSLAYLDTLLSVPAYIGLGSIMLDHDMKSIIEHEGFQNIMEKHADTAQWRVYRELMSSKAERPGK